MSPALDPRGLPMGTRLRADEIAPRDAAERLRDGRILMIDVRTDPEWALVRIEPAELIPLDQLERRLDEIEPKPGQQVAFLCHHGRRSLTAALAARGTNRPELANAVSIYGGLELWSAAVEPSVPRYVRGPGVLRLLPG